MTCFVSHGIHAFSVGQAANAQTFCLHSSLLIQKSPWFRNALDGDRWTEGREWKVKLEKDDPEIFAYFAAWLYQGDTIIQDLGAIMLIKMYILADYFMLLDLQNTTVTRLVALFESQEAILEAEHVHIIYTKGGERCLLRKLVASVVVRQCRLPTQNNELCEDLLNLLACLEYAYKGTTYGVGIITDICKQIAYLGPASTSRHPEDKGKLQHLHMQMNSFRVKPLDVD